ncbi:MAG: sigma-70 family RNA polymerase sigma factor, partial [Pyrinomonadaceae bacterium]
MNDDFTLLLSETIFIPRSIRAWTTETLPVSIRLWNVLRRLGYQNLGDLQGESYKEIYQTKNCGRKSLLELRDFIAEYLSDNDAQELTNFIERKKLSEIKTRQSETIYIPQEARGLSLSSFSLPTRLSNVLGNLDFHLVGDLQGFAFNEFKNLGNCGKKTFLELQEFVAKIQQDDFNGEMSVPQIVLMPQELNLSRLVEFIDGFLNELPPRERDILDLRFGASGSASFTLEEVGEKYGLTRERIRQIQSQLLKTLKNRFGQAGERLFGQISRDCLAAVCPLTPQLLVFWTEKDTADFSFSPSFYVRLLSELAPEVPVLAAGQISQGHPRTRRASEICQEIKSILRQRYDAASLVEIFEQLKNTIDDLEEREFLDALEFSNYLAL